MTQLVQPVKSQDAWYTRYGQSLHKWTCHITPGAAQVVLTNACLVYNLSRGEQVIVRQTTAGVRTLNDNCTFEIGYTDQPDGAGNFHGVAQPCYMVTAAGAGAGRECSDMIFRPPVRIRYRDGARSITLRVDANDAACEICCGWAGWCEEEVI